MTEVLTIGEPLALFASNDLNQSIENSIDFTKYLAGAEVNVAIGVNRLGHSVEYLSQVGNDPFGNFVISELRRNHILTNNITRSDDYPTGIEFKSLTDHNDPQTFYLRKNSAATHIDSNIVQKINVSDFKLAHLTGIFPCLSLKSYQTTINLIKKLNESNIPICFDPNLRPALWSSKEKMRDTLNFLAKSATIFLPGLSEAQILTNLKAPEDISNYYFQESPKLKLLIIKDGAKGTYAFAKNNFKIFLPSFKVDYIVDTVGAGDGFATGLLTALLEKKDLKQAIIRANAIGALAIQVRGDNTGYPTQTQLKDFLSSHSLVNNAKL